MERFYRNDPAALRPTVRAVAAVKDGEPICVAGVQWDGFKYVAFADGSEKFKQHPMTGLRMVRRVLGMAAALKAPVYAGADDLIAESGSFLRRIGFEETHTPGVFIWQA